MRVLQTLFSGLGGHGSVFFSLVEASQGYELDHYALFYGVEPLRPEYQKKCEELGIRFRYFSKGPGWDLKTQLAILSWFREARPDAIIVHSPQTLPAAWLYRLLRQHTRLVQTEHQPNHLKTRRQWFLSALAFFLAQHVVYLTDLYREQVQGRLRWLFRTRKTRVIPNGINLDLFRPSPFRENRGGLVVGMQARMSKTKDQATFIRAAAHIRKNRPEVRFVLAGDGELRSFLEKVNSENGNAVEFLGTLDEGSLVEFLQNLDVYVHATLGETMSTAIMQAQAVGLPIIASDVSGVHNLVVDGATGLLAPPRSPKALAAAIERLLEDPKLRLKLAENSLRHAQTELSHRRTWEAYYRLIK